MCRSIKPLFNFEPPATHKEVHDASLQFVRKLSGFHHPSRINEAAFNRGVDEIALAARRLLDTLVTDAQTKDREVEALKTKARYAHRFGYSGIAKETLG